MSYSDDASHRKLWRCNRAITQAYRSNYISKEVTNKLVSQMYQVRMSFRYGLPTRFKELNKLERSVNEVLSLGIHIQGTETGRIYGRKADVIMIDDIISKTPEDVTLTTNENEGDSTMQSDHSSKLFAQMNPNAFTVGVKFGEARYNSEEGLVTFVENYHKEYTYATEYDLKLGELVLVETPRHGFSVAQVTRVDDFLDVTQFNRFNELKWVVDAVHVEDYVKTRRQLTHFGDLARKAHAAGPNSRT